MSEHITHTAVFEDSARLALHSSTICDELKLSLRKHHAIGQLASITRHGAKFFVQLLNTYRDQWPTRKAGDFTEEKLAFVLGWLCHRAADRQFKPVFRYSNPEHYSEERSGPSDSSIYEDTVIFREVYANGNKDPFIPSSLDFGMDSHPAAKAVSVDEVQDLFGGIWQRSLLELQTFIPQDDNLDEWLDLVFARLEPYTVDVNRYSEAYHRHDPDLYKRFITDINFYDATDPIILLARSIHRGAVDYTIDLSKAVEAAEKQSLYAQALHKGYGYLQAASDFFEHIIDLDEFSVKLHIGMPRRVLTIDGWQDAPM